MKERAKKLLSELRELVEPDTDQEFIDGGWSRLKSLVETGVNPKNTILSLWNDQGNSSQPFEKHERKVRLSYESHQKLWAAMTIFENAVDALWDQNQGVENSLAKIEDFLDVKEKDLRGIVLLTPLDRKIIERVFASSTSANR